MLVCRRRPLPQGTTEPRLSQIEPVNICPACHRNVLQSSWALWATDEPVVILLGTGRYREPPKNKSLLSGAQPIPADRDPRLTNHKWHFLMPGAKSRPPAVWLCVVCVVCCQCGIWGQLLEWRPVNHRGQSSKTNMLSYPDWSTVSPEIVCVCLCVYSLHVLIIAWTYWISEPDIDI